MFMLMCYSPGRLRKSDQWLATEPRYLGYTGATERLTVFLTLRTETGWRRTYP